MESLSSPILHPLDPEALPWAAYRPLSYKTSAFPLQEPVSCPYCNSEPGEELFEIQNFQFFGDVDGSNRITHRVVRCLNCGLLHTNPWMTHEGSRTLLEKAGRSYGFCDPIERVQWVRAQFPGARRVLDIGCGNGDFLGAFPSEFECAGVDVDEQLLSQAQQKYPRAVFYSGSFEPALESFAPEVVTLFHVLEHLPDPLGHLRRLRAYGGDNVSLVVEVPVLDRAEETQGEDLCGFFSLTHRTHFTKSSLKALLKKSGWRLDETDDLTGNGYRVVARPCQPEEVLPTVHERDRDRNILRSYLDVWKGSVRRVKKILGRMPFNESVLIWGAGHHLEYLVRMTSLFQNPTCFLIVDSDPLKRGMLIHGIPVVSPDQIPDAVWMAKDVPIVVSSFVWRKSIQEALLKLGVSEDRVVLLYP